MPKFHIDKTTGCAVYVSLSFAAIQDVQRACTRRSFTGLSGTAVGNFQAVGLSLCGPFHSLCSRYAVRIRGACNAWQIADICIARAFLQTYQNLLPSVTPDFWLENLIGLVPTSDQMCRVWISRQATSASCVVLAG